MPTTFKRTKIEISQRRQITYEERSILGGLVKWWEKIRADTLGNDLIIETDAIIEKIYLNGKEL